METDLFTIGNFVWAVLHLAPLAALWFAFDSPGRVPQWILWLLVADYTFVNLAFSTYTMNIVMLKDISFPYLAIVLTLVWAVGELSWRGAFEFRRSPVNLPIAITMLYLAHSSATSPIFASSIEEYAKFFANFTLVLLLAKFLCDRVWLDRYLWMILINATLMTVYALGQWQGVDYLEEIGRGFDWGFPGWGGQEVFVSTHGNQNFFSGYLVATIPILAGWWLTTHRPNLLFALPIVVFGMTLCVVKGEARGAYLGLIGAGFFFAVGLVWNRKNLAILSDPIRKKLLGASAAVVLSGALITAIVRPDLAMKPVQMIQNNLGTLFDFEVTYTNAVRFIFWQDFIDGGLREPLTGVGLGVVNEKMPASRPNWYHHVGVSHNTMHAHNEWFEWVMESGVIGTSLYVWLNIALFFAWGRTLVRRRAEVDFPILLGVGLGLFSQLVQSCFDPETRWTGNAVTNWFSAGLMIAWSNLPAPLDERPAPAWDGIRRLAPAPVVPGVLAIGVVVLLGFTWNMKKIWDADFYHRNANAYTERSNNPADIRTGLDNARLCAELNPYHLSNYYKLAYAHLALGDYAGSLRAYRMMQEFAPDYAQVHINLSYVKHSLNYRYGSAWERDRAAIIEDNTRNHVAAAEYWAMLGRMERVLPHLRHALKIDQDDDDGSRSVLFYRHDDIHYRLAQALGVTGDVERAIRELENALSRNPGNQDALFQLLQIYYQSGQNARADAVIAQIREKNPDSELRHLAEADRAFRRGDLDAALLSARALSEFLPWPDPGAQGGISPSVQTIARIAETAIGRSQRVAVAYALIGRCHAAIGDYSKAHAVLVEAARLAPGDPWILDLTAKVSARSRI